MNILFRLPTIANPAWICLKNYHHTSFHLCFLILILGTKEDDNKVWRKEKYTKEMLKAAFTTHKDIIDGIIRLEHHVTFLNFENTVRLTSEFEEMSGIRSSWWRALGIRTNFGLLNGTMVCYRCNMTLDASKGVARIARHLNSSSHAENSRVFFASCLVPSPKIQFPVSTSRVHKPSTQVMFARCPVIEKLKFDTNQLKLVKEKTTRKRGKNKKGIFVGEMFDLLNSTVTKLTGKRIEEDQTAADYKMFYDMSAELYDHFLQNNPGIFSENAHVSEIKRSKSEGENLERKVNLREIASSVALRHLGDTKKRGKSSGSAKEKQKEDIVEENKERENFVKERIKDKSLCSIAETRTKRAASNTKSIPDASTNFAEEIDKVIPDPQGYVALFEKQKDKINMTAPTMRKYYQNLKLAVKESAMMGVDVQKYDTIIKSLKIGPSAINSRLKALNFFSKRVANDRYGKTMKFAMLKVPDVLQKRKIAPLDYYRNFNEFKRFFKNQRADVGFVATLCYYFGLRVFEA